MLGCVRLFATPWTIQSLGFSRSEYWSGEPSPSPGYLPIPGIEPRSPALQADSLPAEPQGKGAGKQNGRVVLLLRLVWLCLQGHGWPPRAGGLTCTIGRACPSRQTWEGQAALSAFAAASLSSAQNTLTPQWPTWGAVF